MSGNKIALIGTGEVLGISTSISAIIGSNKEKLFLANFSNKDSNLGKLIGNKVFDLPESAKNLTVFNNDLIFDASFMYEVQSQIDAESKKKKDDVIDFIVAFNRVATTNDQSAQMVCHVFKMGEDVQLAIKIKTAFFSEENILEKTVSSVLKLLSIVEASLIIRNKALNNEAINHFKRRAEPKGFPVAKLDKHYSENIVLTSSFNLKESTSAFGKGLFLLTKIDSIDLFITCSGANYADASARLQYTNTNDQNFEKKSFYLSQIFFDIKKDAFTASGTITLKINKKLIDFTLSGQLGLGSFLISASTQTSFTICDRIIFSSLSLMIGAGASGLAFGMTGRTSYTPSFEASNGNTAKDITVYAGFIVTVTNVPLITCSVSSSNGIISLRDIVVDIAGITFMELESLDQISVGDFEFETNDKNINKEYRISEWEKISKGKLTNDLTQNFLNVMPKDLVSTSAENIETNFLTDDLTIVTDKKEHRHYRVDKSGSVSLCCQMYVCTEPLGEMKVGTFFCGTLQIFNVKAKALFYINPKKTVMAIVQISEFNIGNIFFMSASKSNVATDIEIENPGVAGTLIPKNIYGPTVYFNVNAENKKFELFVSANLKILSILEIDVYILIVKGIVKVNFNVELLGMKVSYLLDTSYQSFNVCNFKSFLKFDCSVFEESVQAARKSINNFANSKRETLNDVHSSLTRAQETVAGLRSEIRYYENEINENQNRISFWHPLDTTVAIANIAAYEGIIATLNASMIIACGGLEVAKRAVSAANSISDLALSAIDGILKGVVEIFLIKSFELGIDLNPEKYAASASLNACILGRNYDFKAHIELPSIQSLVANEFKTFILNYVKQIIDNATKEEIKTLDNSNQNSIRGTFKTTRSDSQFSALNIDDFMEISNLLNELTSQNNRFINIGIVQKYQEDSDFQNELNEIILKICEKNIDLFSKLPTNWEEQITKTIEIFNQSHTVRKQCLEQYDKDFENSLNEVLETIKAQNPEIIGEDFKEYIAAVGKVVNENEKNKNRDSLLKSQQPVKSLYEQIMAMVHKNEEKKKEEAPLSEDHKTQGEVDNSIKYSDINQQLNELLDNPQFLKEFFDIDNPEIPMSLDMIINSSIKRKILKNAISSNIQKQMSPEGLNSTNGNMDYGMPNINKLMKFIRTDRLKNIGSLIQQWDEIVSHVNELDNIQTNTIKQNFVNNIIQTSKFQ